MNDKKIGVRNYPNYGYLVEGILCIYGCSDTLFPNDNSGFHYYLLSQNLDSKLEVHIDNNIKII